MRNKLLSVMTFLAITVSPSVATSDSDTLAKKTIKDEKIVENIKNTINTYRLPTKEEVAQKQIEENIKKLEEERKAAEAARIAAEQAAEAARAQELATRSRIVPAPVRTNGDNSDAIAYGRARNAAVFGEAHWSALFQLWLHESGWRDNAINYSSGACGIPQFINGCVLGDHVSQIDRGLVYIKARYGNPTNALAFWNAHNWY